MAAIKDRPVSYLDELASDYRDQLDGVQSLPDLKAVMAKWEPVAGDAFDTVAGMTKADFADFQGGFAKERRRRFAGVAWAERFGAILLPEMLLRISVLADQFSVPEGALFIRALEERRFKKRNGRFYDTLAEPA